MILYYWPTHAYVKGYDVCLVLKTVRHKPYGDLQSFPVSFHRWKDLSMDFVTGLLISADWKGSSLSRTTSSMYAFLTRIFYNLITRSRELAS